MNIDELFASAGISMGGYVFYKIAMKIYNKYIITSECIHPTVHSTDIVMHIKEIEPSIEIQPVHAEIQPVPVNP